MFYTTLTNVAPSVVVVGLMVFSFFMGMDTGRVRENLRNARRELERQERKLAAMK